MNQMQKSNNLAIVDIDGVLNHQQFYQKRNSDSFSQEFENILQSALNKLDSISEEHLSDLSKNESRKIDADTWEFRLRQLDVEAVELLDDFCVDNNVSIIFSSTWRSMGVENLKFLFNELLGMKAEIIGITGSSNSRIRGKEIKDAITEYLVDHRNYSYDEASIFNRYAIIDDDSDMLYDQRSNYHYVDTCVGLTSNTLYRIARFFKSFNV